MKPDRLFPERLLEATDDTRCAYFANLTIAHPLLVEIDQKLRKFLSRTRGGWIVMVFGPAGVGKTTFLTRIEQWLVDLALPTLHEDPGRVAVLRLDAVTEGRPSFSWADYYRRGLHAFDEPLIDAKSEPKTQQIPLSEYRRSSLRRNATIGDLRYALEQALLHRKPLACLVDEGQHFAKIASGRRFVDQMDCLKSLATLGNVPHALFGSYGLLDLVNLNGQLSRRTVLFHFRRYRGDSKKDIQAFQSAIWTFQKHMPLIEEPDLVKNWEYLMIHSVGCIGILKEWLRRGLDLALQDSGSLEMRHLEDTVLAASQLRNIATEAWEGEQRTITRQEDLAELRRLTGFQQPPQSSRPEKKPPSASKSRRKPQPGQRRPGRDGVGGTE